MAATKDATNQLLMIANFVHESATEVRVDIVRFTNPINLKELRVVPKGYPPHVTLKSPELFGKTEPNDFKLELYCNDATNPLTPTFLPLGCIDLADRNLTLDINCENPCDTVVTRGIYSGLSICVYGTQFVENRELSMSSTLQSYSTQTRQSPNPYSDDGSTHKRGSSPIEGGGGDKIASKRPKEDWSSLLDSYNTLFDPLSPDHSPEHSFDMYDDDIPTTKRSAPNSAAGFEEFSDEEIAFGDDDFDMQEQDQGIDFEFEDTWMSTNYDFNPYQTEISKLETFPSLVVTPHEAIVLKKPKQEYGGKKNRYDEVKRLKELVEKQHSLKTLSLKWIESTEEISQQLYPGLAQLMNRSPDIGTSVLQTLAEWVTLCISESTLYTLTAPVNVRALKAGLRLCLSLCSLGESAVEFLLALNVVERMVEIICQPAAEMPSSIKLQVLRCLSALLDYPLVMEAVLNLDNDMESDGYSLYKKLLQVLLLNQTSRVQYSISSLLQKIHIFENLSTLKRCVEQVIEATPDGEYYWAPPDPAPTNEDNMPPPTISEESKRDYNNNDVIDSTETQPDSDTRSNSEMQTTSLEKKDIPVLPSSLIMTIVKLLKGLTQSFNKINNLAILPPKVFPGICSSEQTAQEVFMGVARMCKSKQLMECMVVLLTAPTVVNAPGVYGAVRNLLLELISTQNGLLFLSATPSLINSMIRALLQSTESEVPLDALQSLDSFLDGEESKDSCTPLTLGMMLVHHLQVLQLLDVIRQAPKQTMNDIESECLPALHNLFTMTLIPIGKYAVSHVLSLDNNLTYLLPFLEPRGQKDYDAKLSRSSISSRYAAVLVLQILRSDVVLLNDCLTPNIRRLLSIAEFFQCNTNQSSTMSALYSWLHPLKCIGETAPTITALMNVIKEGMSQLSWNKPDKGSAAIITSLLMVLVRCCSEPHSNEYKPESVSRQHRDAIAAVFSFSGIDVITTLLKKLSGILLPLWSQKQTIGVSNAVILVLLSTLSLKLLRLLLCELLNDGTFQLRDTRVLQALFTLHTVMCSAPKSGVFQSSALEIQSLIISCLVTYTNPKATNYKEPISPSNSCWCMLVNELLDYTQATPHSFLSGLMLLSELLPLPLPVHSPKGSSLEDMSVIIQHRHLWVGHLVPLATSINSMLDMIVLSQSVSLQQILRRVSAQLVDLAPIFAMMFAKKIASEILAQIDAEDESGKEMDTSVSSAEKKESSSLLMSLLTLCAILSGQPMFKTTLISLISSQKSPEIEEGETIDSSSNGTAPTETTYHRFIPLLLFLVQKLETSLPVKLCVMTILQSLVDTNISLRGQSKEQRTFQELADSLPLMGQIEHIASAVVKHIGSHDQPLSTITVGLKIILVLLGNTPGRTILLTLLPSTIKSFNVLLKRLIVSLKESTPPSTESLQCLSLFLDTLSSFIIEEKGLSPSFPVSLIKCFISSDTNDSSLLQELLPILEDGCQDRYLLEGFTVSINDLIMEFDKHHAATVTEIGVTPLTLELPPMTDIDAQFVTRVSVLEAPIEDVISPEYWLSSPPYDETQLEPERVTTDLTSLASEVNPNLNLQEELKKQLLPSPPSTPSKERKRRKIVFSGPEAQKRLREAIQQRKAMGRGRDMFRARKQNTSRPPSMHVDDFMNISHRMPTNVPRGSAIPPGRAPRDGGGNSSSNGGVSRGREGFGMSRSYMFPPPMYPPHIGGGRFVGGPVTSHYSRRDIPGLPMPPTAAPQSWERRAQHFLASMHHKQDSLVGRPSMWPMMPPDPYSRARSASRMVEIMSSYGQRPMPSGHVSSRLSSSRRT